MASEEQLRFADIVKRGHASLRADSARRGAAAAWGSRVRDERALSEYCRAMTALAALWRRNNAERDCRIAWIGARLRDYFREGGRERARRREAALDPRPSPGPGPPGEAPVDGDVRVLDVGSCYGPLGALPRTDVTALDLCPSPSAPSVLRGDFLSVRIGGETATKTEDGELLRLPRGRFHAVVFSLLLEYLPSAGLRAEACERAREVLEPGGLLVVVTPDSNRAGANWKLMADWRHTLALMGFLRVYYEKLRHVHCMAFRKCHSPETSRLWARKNYKPHFTGKILIPQDFDTHTDDEAGTENTDEVRIDPEDVLCAFREMPFC